MIEAWAWVGCQNGSNLSHINNLRKNFPPPNAEAQRPRQPLKLHALANQHRCRGPLQRLVRRLVPRLRAHLVEQAFNQQSPKSKCLDLRDIFHNARRSLFLLEALVGPFLEPDIADTVDL
jgi:hypothetical protein